jgi:transposase
VLAATRYAMKQLAQRFRALDAEIKDLDRQLTRLVMATAPKFVALRGVGIHTPRTLLVIAGDNPERLRSEGAFARLTGTAPIPASSGQTHRFRLSRGGDRQANAALHHIAVNRLANGDQRRKTDVKRTDRWHQSQPRRPPTTQARHRPRCLPPAPRSPHRGRTRPRHRGLTAREASVGAR